MLVLTKQGDDIVLIDIMTGIWSTLDILTLLGQSATTDFEFVTELSESNTTHPLLQTVADGRAGVKFINIFCAHFLYKSAFL
jgi:hypothetical protein